MEKNLDNAGKIICLVEVRIIYMEHTSAHCIIILLNLTYAEVMAHSQVFGGKT